MFSQHAGYSSLLANLPVIYFIVSVSTFGSAACMPSRAHLVNLTGLFLYDLQASGDPVRLHGTDNLLIPGITHVLNLHN